MMTHIFANNKGERIIAAKGAPEAIMNVSNLEEVKKQQIQSAIIALATEGYRVLGVGQASFEGNNFPEKQQDFHFQFKGLLAFYDPPKKNIQKVLEDFYAAGIAVKIITGDNAETTAAIAKQIDFKGYEKSISGDELMELDEAELRTCVMNTQYIYKNVSRGKIENHQCLKSQQSNCSHDRRWRK